MMKYYTGIGSRETPAHILDKMTLIAKDRLYQGYTLRSGGAPGADTAFEAGADCMKDIYLPWKGFNGNQSELWGVCDTALEMAKHYHPNWAACSREARLFHARNCYQVLGGSLEIPSEFIICWTPGKRITGGNGQALRIAIDWKIPITYL